MHIVKIGMIRMYGIVFNASKDKICTYIRYNLSHTLLLLCVSGDKVWRLAIASHHQMHTDLHS